MRSLFHVVMGLTMSVVGWISGNSGQTVSMNTSPEPPRTVLAQGTDLGVGRGAGVGVLLVKGTAELSRLSIELEPDCAEDALPVFCAAKYPKLSKITIFACCPEEAEAGKVFLGRLGGA